MKQRIVIVAVVVGLGSIHACTYELPATGQTESSTSSSNSSSSNSSSSSSSSSSGSSTSSSSSSSSSSGEGGKGGSGGGGGSGGANEGGKGGGPPFGEVACGQGTCDPPAACCTNQAGNYSCLDMDACAQSGQIFVACDGAEDCPLSNCCGQFDGMTMKYTGAKCSIDCNSPNVVLCHFDGDKVCPAGRTCTQSTLLGPGYGYCI